MERRVSFFLRPSSAKTDRTEESGLGKDHQSAFAKTLFTSDTISVNGCYGPSAFLFPSETIRQSWRVLLQNEIFHNLWQLLNSPDMTPTLKIGYLMAQNESNRSFWR